MAAKTFLAFDLGASSGRAILGSIENNKLQLREVHRFPNRMVQVMGHYHWDILGLFDELKTGLAKAVQDSPAAIESIGIDTWGVDFGLVGRGNTLLGAPYAYRDIDSFEWVDKADKTVSRDEIYQRTGIQFLPFNSIFQLYRMVVEDNPMLDSAEQLLFTPDLLNFLMTGERVSEYSIASTSQLLNPYTKTWDAHLFEKLGLPLNIMPEVIMPGSRVGTLLPEIQAATGAGELTVVAPACHDTGSAVAAVPASGQNWAYLSSGTWSLLGVEMKEPVINAEVQQANFTNEGGVNGSIRFLRNLSGLWLLQCLRSAWAKQGSDIDYGEMTKLAETAEPFKCLINPDDERFINPPDMPAAIVDFCRETGQTPPASQGEFIRCCLESLALKYRQCLDDIDRLTGAPVDVLHIVGGGTQNTLLNQFAANACGRPVTAGPVEATAIGNILMQAVACGELDSIEQGRDLVKASFPLQNYDPQNTDAWQDQAHILQKRVPNS